MQTPGLAIAKLLVITAFTACAALVFFMSVALTGGGGDVAVFVLLYVAVLAMQIVPKEVQWPALLSYVAPFVMELAFMLVRGTSAYDIVYALGFTGAMATVGLAVFLPLLEYFAENPEWRTTKLSTKTTLKNGNALLMSLGFAAVFVAHWQVMYPQYVDAIGRAPGLVFLALTLWAVVGTARTMAGAYLASKSSPKAVTPRV